MGDQLDLFGEPPRDAGRHELALRRAVDELVEDYPAACSAALALAAALDLAERQRSPAMTAQLARSYVDALDRLGLTPARAPRARGGPDEGEGGESGLGRFGVAALVHPA